MNNALARLGEMMGRKPAVDPRSKSVTKIEHDLLPYVRRSALARVKDWMPPPDNCNHCGGMVMLMPNSEIYGRSYGDWPYTYACTECDAYVGLHPHTDLPLGTLANKEEREARKANKQAFNALMNVVGMSRPEAYGLLASKMGMKRSECHWSMFSVDQANKAGAICRELLESRS